MKWLYMLIATILLFGVWVVGNHALNNTDEMILRRAQTEAIIRLNRIVSSQQKIIVNLTLENNTLKRYIVEREWTDRRWKARAEANLQQLNCISVVMDSANHDKLDSFNDWWEGIR